MPEAQDFWSRRRAAVEAEARAEDEAARQIALKTQDEELAERRDEELLAELDLPEPEALDSAEDVRTFLEADLPQRLKTRALRRLWRLNPMLANLDGLVEYGEDYTDSATVIDNLQTVYQVGKGMLARFEEVANSPTENEERANGAAIEEEQVAAPHSDPEPEPEVEPEAQTEAVLAQTDEPPAQNSPVAAEEPEFAAQRPGRMRFEFNETLRVTES